MARKIPGLSPKVNKEVRRQMGFGLNESYIIVDNIGQKITVTIVALSRKHVQFVDQDNESHRVTEKDFEQLVARYINLSQTGR